MRISVVIPVYNVEAYVRQCVLSVLEQTMSEDVECIIVDDCGTDKSMEVVVSVINEYKKQNFGISIPIKIVRHATNRGLSAARNTGIKEASGEYVFFIDSDDYIYPDCLEHLWQYVTCHPGIDIVQGTMQRENEKFQKWLLWPLIVHHVPEYSESRNECRRRFQAEQYLPMAQNRLIRRSFLIDNKLFFKEGIIHEDNLWTFLAGKYLKSIALCSKITYYYRENPHSITTDSAEEKGYRNICLVCDEILRKIDLSFFFEHEIACLLRQYYKVYNQKNRDPFLQIETGNIVLLKRLYFLAYNQSSKRIIRIGQKLVYYLFLELLRIQLLWNKAFDS